MWNDGEGLSIRCKKILIKLAVFLLSDLVFAALLTLLNVDFSDTIRILSAYLVIALFATTPIFLSVNTSIKMTWIDWHPFYQVSIGLKNAYFGNTYQKSSLLYLIRLRNCCSVCGCSNRIS